MRTSGKAGVRSRPIPAAGTRLATVYAILESGWLREEVSADSGTMQPRATVMRSARLQLVLLALVAVASLVYYGASVSGTLEEVYGDRVPRNPTYHGFRLRAATGLEPEARQSGVHWGDPIVAINGRPFTGYNVLLEELRKSHAGDLMQMTIQPEGQAAHTVSIRLAPVYAARPGVLDLVSRIFFLNIFIPIACLLLGLWVVAARPW